MGSKLECEVDVEGTVDMTDHGGVKGRRQVGAVAYALTTP